MQLKFMTFALKKCAYMFITKSHSISELLKTIHIITQKRFIIFITVYLNSEIIVYLLVVVE